MLVLLHGLGSNAADVDRVTDLPRRGTAAGFIVVTPDAVGSPAVWRVGPQGPDAAFIDALIAHIEATRCVDLARIGIVGFSVGAVFATSYACAREDRVAAVVAATVEAPGGCTRPMPILAFHGTADPVLPYDPPGGKGPMGFAGAEANMASWATTSRCASTPTVTVLDPGATSRRWPDCHEGSEVILYEIIGGGHAWPTSKQAGDPLGSGTISATNRTLAFLARHSLRATS